ncbi:MAG: YbhB/YbcL family Raf kinase inhibitor-like protein [Streptosporangiaceae bacterium]|nr:YbhB/YbcL family Raf kinase inhibitor-like protein [Streptosporangiaceae bacterium]
MGLERVRRAVAVAAAVAGIVPLAGCGLLGSGNVLLTPSVMTVSSGAFSADTLPVRYTCLDRKPINPPLGWSGAPPGTKSIALVLDDSSAPITPYVYWLVFDISPETSAIQEGQLPTGARQAQNSAGAAAYKPPCPHGGSHSYRFTVYALKSAINLPESTPLRSAWTAIAAATIGRGRVTVTAYSSPPPS